jgi:hypothetical protein
MGIYMYSRMFIHQVWGMGIRAEFRGTAECSSTRSGREWKGVGRGVGREGEF